MWVYPNSKTVLDEAGLLPVKEYIESRKARVMHYAKGRLLYKRCQESTPSLSITLTGGTSLSGGPLLLIKPKPRRLRAAAAPLGAAPGNNNNNNNNGAYFNFGATLKVGDSG
jgi:hypothetical protein